MVTINRLQAPVMESGKPSYVAEMAMFVVGNQAFPMIFIGMSEEEIGTAIAERTKEISLATRNKVQGPGPEQAKTGPKLIPN